jgi:uncharacterized protein (DUF433 family)
MEKVCACELSTQRSPNQDLSYLFQSKTMTSTISSPTPTEYKYIWLDDRQVPFIEGTTMKVVELVSSFQAYGWSSEELHFQYPHVSLSRVYSALAYYWDHREAIDADIQRRLEYVETLRREAGESPLVKKLRERGLIE